jgi:hypothetical protein
MNSIHYLHQLYGRNSSYATITETASTDFKGSYFSKSKQEQAATTYKISITLISSVISMYERYPPVVTPTYSPPLPQLFI